MADYTARLVQKDRIGNTATLRLEFTNGVETFINDYHYHDADYKYKDVDEFIAEKLDEFIKFKKAIDELPVTEV